MSTLVSRLGLGDDARVVIISCDELGFCQAANSAIYQALRTGSATSASLMVPAPWAREAAASYHGEDIGVHLTLNSELDLYRYGPITHSPSLLDGEGGFPRTIGDVWEHADLDEVRREWRAQIDAVVLWGFRISHVNAHLGGVELKPEFFDVYLDLAEEYRLAARLPAVEEERRIGFPLRALAEERGVVSPDRVIAFRGAQTENGNLAELFSKVPVGVTELHLHPANDTPELRSADPDWQARVKEFGVVGPSGALAAAASAAKITVIGYEVLQSLLS